MEKHPNYFRRMDRPGGDDHPIDLIVRERLHEEDAQARLLSLQREVEAQLGKNRRAFLELETLRNNIRIDREEVFFNVGYEHGLVEGAARASGVALSVPAQQLASNLRALIEQAQLPRGHAALVVLQVLGGVLLSGTEVPPQSPALESGTPQ